MSDTSADTDAVWKALAEPTRRAVLDVLARRPHTTGELVERFPDLCRTAVMKHLDVLEAAGLLVVQREGRVRWNHLDPTPIRALHDRWVSRHVARVASALDRLKAHVESGGGARRRRTGGRETRDTHARPSGAARTKTGRSRSPRTRNPAA